MDEIASLKAQIEGLQAPTEQAPVMVDAPVTTTQLDSIISSGGGANTSAGSNNFGDYRDEMENTPPERPDYNPFRPDLDTGFLQIQNPDAEGILKYGNDPRKLESFKPQYDEYLNLFDRLKRRSRMKYKLTPEGRERQRQEEARFKELYNIFGVIGTGGAFSPMTTDSSMEGFNRDDMDANYVYSQFAIDQPERPMVEQITFESPFPTPNLNIPNPMTGETPDGSPYQPQPLRTPGYDTLSPNQPTQVLQAPPELQNRMVDEPQPIPQAPSQDIQASIDYLAKLPKMNIPQIPDIEQIRQKMEEANMTFPEPVSYQDQLQAIKDLPPMPNNFMGDSARNVMSQIQQPQMQSFGRPQLPFQGGFMPEMRAGGGGIDKAIYDLKFKLNG